VADLGPFAVIDAAATASADRDKIALTLVNRNPDEPETIDIVLRDLAFDSDAEIATVTAARGHEARALPDVEGACVEEGSDTPKGATLTLTLPPQSFPVIEAATAGG
jgi:alpha-L-arabinofuranosidase